MRSEAECKKTKKLKNGRSRVRGVGDQSGISISRWSRVGGVRDLTGILVPNRHIILLSMRTNVETVLSHHKLNK